MKIELDLSVPEGWRFVGYRRPDYKQGILNTTGEFEVVNCNTCDEYHLTFERIEPEIDVELEAMKAKFPERSRVKIIRGSCAGENHIVKKVERIERIGSKKEIAVWFMTNTWIEPEKLEPYVEDTELEEAKKRFPVGSWFKLQNLDMVQQVREVIRRGTDLLILCTNGQAEFVTNCTPFPLPVWRCCESDKPKESGYYYLRSKDRKWQRLAYFSSNESFSRNEGWGKLDTANLEWLDEGEL